jgi:methylated-DNA-[protein]-cysteine S-methyltransferase
LLSYGTVAKAIGNPKAARAVGGALHINRTPIVVPCHRVVGSGGSLTGFGGGLDLKKALLLLENAQTICQ